MLSIFDTPEPTFFESIISENVMNDTMDVFFLKKCHANDDICDLKNTNFTITYCDFITIVGFFERLCHFLKLPDSQKPSMGYNPNKKIGYITWPSPTMQQTLQVESNDYEETIFIHKMYSFMPQVPLK